MPLVGIISGIDIVNKTNYDADNCSPNRNVIIMPMIRAVTKNIIPLVMSQAMVWPKSGIKNDNAAARIAFAILFYSI